MINSEPNNCFIIFSSSASGHQLRLHCTLLFTQHFLYLRKHLLYIVSIDSDIFATLAVTKPLHLLPRAAPLLTPPTSTTTTNPPTPPTCRSATRLGSPMAPQPLLLFLATCSLAKLLSSQAQVRLYTEPSPPSPTNNHQAAEWAEKQPSN